MPESDPGEREGRLDGWRGHASQLAVVAAVLLAAILAVVFGLQSSYDGTVQEGDRTRRSLEVVNRLLVAIIDAEAAHRAYVFDRDETDVQEFDRAREDADRALATLLEITAVDAPQQTRLAHVRARVNERLEDLAREIEALRAGQPMPPPGVRRPAASPIRVLLRDVMREQERQFETVRTAAQRTRRMLRIVLLVAAVPLALVFVAQWALHARWRAAEGALRASEENFRRFFDHAAVGLAQATPDGRVLRVNSAFARLTGREAWTLPGRSLASLVDPEAAAGLEAALVALIRSDARLDTEVPLAVEGGGPVWVRLTAAMDRDARGRASRVLLVAQDVTVRRELEEQLRASTARLQAILDHSPNVMWIKDVDGRYLLVNRRFEEVSGIPAERAIGHTDDELMPPEFAASFRATDRAVIEAGRPLTVEEGLGNGSTTYLTVKFPMPDEQGRPRAIGGIAVDITPRKRAEQDREDQARFRELFLAVVGHDLRSPLGAIVLSLDVAVRDPSLPERTREMLLRARAAGRRMNQMIADLLDFTRGRLGSGIALDRRDVDLADVVRETVAEVRAAHPDREIRLDIEGDARGAWDADRMAQVVANLVSNAVRHGEADAPIDVCLRATSDEVRLFVHNRGPAIDPEKQRRIFDPFRTAEAVKPREGLGLGLWIARQIAEGHGGTVDVSSSDEQGTTFVVRLPKVPAGPEGGDAPPSSA